VSISLSLVAKSDGQFQSRASVRSACSGARPTPCSRAPALFGEACNNPGAMRGGRCIQDCEPAFLGAVRFGHLDTPLRSREAVLEKWHGMFSVLDADECVCVCARSRPFGVALLVAGVDEYGPSLYHTDPSGTFVRYEAKAIGAGSEGAQTQLQEAYSKSMTLAEAETLALNTLKQVHPLDALRGACQMCI